MPSEKAQKAITYPEVKLKHVLGAFWNGAKPEKRFLFGSVSTIILANIITIAVPIFYKKFFDILLDKF